MNISSTRKNLNNSARYIVLSSGLGISLLGASYATPASAITFTHFYEFEGDPQAVEIQVDINELMTEWKYTVTNNSYDPEPGITNGFSGFQLGSFIPEISNIFAPDGPIETSNWEYECCAGPVEWDLPDDEGLGIMPGETGVFGFTTAPRFISTSNGWFHSWANETQVEILNFTVDTAPEVPGELKPVPVPEPSTVLGATLALGLGTLSRKQKKKN